MNEDRAELEASRLPLAGAAPSDEHKALRDHCWKEAGRRIEAEDNGLPYRPSPAPSDAAVQPTSNMSEAGKQWFGYVNAFRVKRGLPVLSHDETLLADRAFEGGFRAALATSPLPTAPAGARMRETLEDIAEHGLRIDGNPTVMFPENDAERRGAIEMYGWWVGYIRDAQSRLRENARAALAAAPLDRIALSDEQIEEAKELATLLENYQRYEGGMTEHEFNRCAALLRAYAAGITLAPSGDEKGK